jgi:SSS family solute:Na+ symporter
MMVIAQGRFDGLALIDYAVVAVYFAGMLTLGWWFSGRQRSSEEYFLAGRRMPWIVAGISLFATLLSTISYLSLPGEMIKHGAIAIYGGMFAYPFVFLIIGFVMIPYLMRLHVTSVYEFLEARFDLTTRLLAASLFILLRLAWMGLILFTASGAMAAMTGLGFVHVVVGVAAIGILYTAMGGIRAVIWTDVAQFVILVGGAVFCIVYVAAATGTGPISWWENATVEERPYQPAFSLDPFERVTTFTIALSAMFWWICTCGSDQVAIQRYFSTPSAPAARKSLACNLVADACLTVLLIGCGLALLSFYRSGLPAEADRVFPHFIAHELPRGVAGLVVAALFAAAMSSLDSGINSISTVVTIDFYQRLAKKAAHSDRLVSVARVVTVVAGLAAVCICFLVDGIPEAKRGNLLDITNRISTFIVGGLGGLFLLAVLVKRCTGPIAVVSVCVGMACGLVIAMGHWFVYEPRPYLVVRGGPDLVGEHWVLDRDEPVVVGSSPGHGGVQLVGEGIRQHQVVITRNGTQWELRQRVGDSTDDPIVYVEGSTPLVPGQSIIEIGPYKLALELRALSFTLVIATSCMVTFAMGSLITWVKPV